MRVILKYYYSLYIPAREKDFCCLANHSDNHVSEKSILIKRAAALGDILLASSILPALKKKYPNCRISFATEFPAILESNPHISSFVSMDVNESRYTHVINLDFGYEQWPGKSIIQSYADLAQVELADCFLKIVIPDRNSTLASEILEKSGILRTTPFVAIQSAGSFWLKNWPVESYEFLVAALKKKHNIPVVLLGTPADPPVAGTIDLRTISDIMTSLAVLAHSCAFIGVDSLLLHCAKALCLPVAAFFGHSDPLLRISVDKKDCIFSSDISCKFCRHRQPSPAFIAICQKQRRFFRYIDIMFQWVLLYQYKHKNTLIENLFPLVFKTVQWREAKKITAPCMKNILPDVAAERIIPWLGNILDSQ